MDDVLLKSLEDGVLTLTMNRPDRLNALNAALLSELHSALLDAAADREVGVIVLAGAGRACCASGWRPRASCTKSPSRPSPCCAARSPAPGCRWRSPAICASPATR